MAGLELSPGITLQLTDIFVIELPLALGAGFLVARRKGFELAFALNALALGVIKAVTDYSDFGDDLVSLGALVGGAYWALAVLGHAAPRGRLRGLLGGLGLLFVLFALIKLLDFYDPFDLLFADTVIIAGLALWVYRRGYPEPEGAGAPGSASGT